MTMNTKLLLLIVFGLFLVSTGMSQDRAHSSKGTPTQHPDSMTEAGQQPSAADLQRDAMSKVGFLAGHWEGTESVLMQDGRRQDCASSDFAESKLGGIALLFQGVVKVKMSPETDPVVVYQGLGVLFYDEKAQEYRLLHLGTDGAYEAYECKLTGTTLRCERRDQENALVCVTLGVDDAGRWIERGERSQDGKTWHETFSTQMSKAAVRSKGKQ